MVSVVINCCFKQQYSSMSHDKTGTSDATDADINKYVVLCWQSRKIAYNVHTFLNKFS
jgi:hypothetical protein